MGLTFHLKAHGPEIHHLSAQGPGAYGRVLREFPQSSGLRSIKGPHSKAMGPQAWLPPSWFQDIGLPLETSWSPPNGSIQQASWALSVSALNSCMQMMVLRPFVYYFPLFPKIKSKMYQVSVSSKVVTLVRENEVSTICALGGFITT